MEKRYDLNFLESELKAASPGHYGRYLVIKRQFNAQIQGRWSSHWPEGNDHGPGHIDRVLDNLAALIGDEPVSNAKLSALELALCMTAVAAHDIGVVNGRSGHARTSAEWLTRIAQENKLLFDPHEIDVLTVVIICHSSSAQIEKECKHLPDKYQVGTHTVRPRLLAALVRLADELDESYLRADSWLMGLLDLPESSRPYWRFCQCITGIDLGASLSSIKITVRFEPDVLASTSGRYSFLEFFSEKISKINYERTKVSGYLLPAFCRTGLSIVLTGKGVFPRPRTIEFNDDDGYDDKSVAAAARRLTAFARQNADLTPSLAPSVSGNVAKDSLPFLRFLFVVGNPGSGKSTFCRQFIQRLAARGIQVDARGDFPFLQALFHQDREIGRRDRFDEDEISEFRIKDLSVYDEALRRIHDTLLDTSSENESVTLIEFSRPRYNTSFLYYTLRALAQSAVVHLLTPLQQCRYRNEQRGGMLERMRNGVGLDDSTFRQNPDLHYTPPAVFDRYESPLQEDQSMILALMPSRDYIRLVNDGDQLRPFTEMIDTIIDARIIPLIQEPESLRAHYDRRLRILSDLATSGAP